MRDRTSIQSIWRGVLRVYIAHDIFTFGPLRQSRPSFFEYRYKTSDFTSDWKYYFSISLKKDPAFSFIEKAITEDPDREWKTL